jgi:hypothetical protein
MFSKKLLGTLVLIAAAVVVPGSATARASERAVGSFSAHETGILAATSLDSAVTSDQEALGTRAGGEVGARVHILAVRTPGTNTPTAPRPHRVQYGGRVRVGADGNGVTAARFATTLAGDDVRYVLVLDTDCNPTRCRPPVEQLDVNLNNALVLHTTHLDAKARHDIALNAIGADENHITVTASGSPGAGARVHILAVRTPGSPGAGIHILALGTTHSAARRDIDYIDDTLGSGLRGTTDRQR